MGTSAQPNTNNFFFEKFGFYFKNLYIKEKIILL